MLLELIFGLEERKKESSHFHHAAKEKGMGELGFDILRGDGLAGWGERWGGSSACFPTFLPKTYSDRSPISTVSNHECKTDKAEEQ
jgi:hypothetical protein